MLTNYLSPEDTITLPTSLENLSYIKEQIDKAKDNLTALGGRVRSALDTVHVAIQSLKEPKAASLVAFPKTNIHKLSYDYVSDTYIGTPLGFQCNLLDFTEHMLEQVNWSHSHLSQQLNSLETYITVLNNQMGQLKRRAPITTPAIYPKGSPVVRKDNCFGAANNHVVALRALVPTKAELVKLDDSRKQLFYALIKSQDEGLLARMNRADTQLQLIANKLSDAIAANQIDRKQASELIETIDMTLRAADDYVTTATDGWIAINMVNSVYTELS